MVTVSETRRPEEGADGQQARSEWVCGICRAFESQGGCDHDFELNYDEHMVCDGCQHFTDDCICWLGPWCGICHEFNCCEDTHV